MNCDTALERLLEAEPAALRGGADPLLDAHLAGCERCRRVADTLVAELEALDAALGDEAEARAGDPTMAADRAMAESRASAGGRRVPLPRPGWRVWAPLAAAAGLTLLLLPGRDGVPPEGGAVRSPAPAVAAGSGAPAVAVAAPPDRGLAVLETENPTITIIWLYDLEES